QKWPKVTLSNTFTAIPEQLLCANTTTFTMVNLRYIHQQLREKNVFSEFKERFLLTSNDLQNV
ncbi:hypothetical protein, partial [Salmonella sp. s51884]|uniref:hypothetical protein n=1 Tax=Salmonella sp. s51884 TaxID=3159654 RepID=UPI0039808B40